MNKLTHEELQAIEHSTKILREYLDLIATVNSSTLNLQDSFLPSLHNYMKGVVAVRTNLGTEVQHIIQSTRQLGIVTGNTQKIIDFTAACIRLDAILTPSFLGKIERLVEKE